VAASNNKDYPTRSLYYCLFAPHTYIFVLHAQLVRGESHNEPNTTGEVATVPNKILLLDESQNIWPKKFRAGYAPARGPALKITLA